MIMPEPVLKQMPWLSYTSIMTMDDAKVANSSKSSGGALLNMRGEIIGICTAGITEGQNLNLAVDYETILSFVSGFLQFCTDNAAMIGAAAHYKAVQGDYADLSLNAVPSQ